MEKTSLGDQSINISLGQNYLTSVSPGMAVYNGRLMIIYGSGINGSGLPDGYELTYSTDGQNWTSTRSGLGAAGIASQNAPALSVLNGMLYMTFQQNNSQHYLWSAVSPDGFTWTTTQHTNLAYGGAPTMIPWNNQLLIAFQQNNSNRALRRKV